MLSDALISEETSLGCVFVPLNVTLPLSPGRAYNGRRPNIHVFAANTSSKLSTSKVKHKYINYRICCHKTHFYVIGLTFCCVSRRPTAVVEAS